MPAQTAGTFAHGLQANAGVLGHLAAAVVAHQNAHAPTVGAEANAHFLGLGMAGDVGQRLLQQAVELGLFGQGQLRQVAAQ